LWFANIYKEQKYYKELEEIFRAAEVIKQKKTMDVDPNINQSMQIWQVVD
jgi:hypothetical protein